MSYTVVQNTQRNQPVNAVGSALHRYRKWSKQVENRELVLFGSVLRLSNCEIHIGRMYMCHVIKDLNILFAHVYAAYKLIDTLEALVEGQEGSYRQEALVGAEELSRLSLSRTQACNRV